MFLLRQSRDHFRSLAPGWEHTMMNSTHIRSLAGSQTEKHSDIGVIGFCQKHRNSHPTPPGVDKAAVHSLACCRSGMCSCCDYLPLQRKGFLWGPMEKCSCLPSAMISAPVGLAQRAKVSRPAGGFPQALVWAVVITAYIRAPTLRAHSPLWKVVWHTSHQCVVGVGQTLAIHMVWMLHS